MLLRSQRLGFLACLALDLHEGAALLLRVGNPGGWGGCLGHPKPNLANYRADWTST